MHEITESSVSPKIQFIDLFSKENLFLLDGGENLEKVRIAYQTYGKLNDEGTNAILICHALTGNSHAAGILTKEAWDENGNTDLLNKYFKMFKGKSGWWDALIGPEKTFNTDKYFVICSNILGSCYGSTGPVSINPKTLKPFQIDFPSITVRDIVRIQKSLIKTLGVNKIRTVAGGSLGGMQALEWGIMYPELVESVISIGTSAKHSAWAIGISEAQRLAIKNDPEWLNGYYKKQPAKGLSLARQIAMISYRSMLSFEDKFGREYINNSKKFQVSNYLEYQGNKLVERFDANTYLLLTDVMDKHDISTNRDKTENVLKEMKTKLLAIGISSDILYPTHEQKYMAEHASNAKYAEIKSRHGHDAFLIEFDQLSKIIGEFLESL
ncbi:MAG: homoserine O-acetyltransferase [Ignavibacteriaceae bacterium]|nr:homoserine O-acetyltransferase [Ignavibacteriaceae bacterium]